MVWTLREWEAATADSNGLGLGGWLGWSLGVQKQVKSSFGAGRLLASSLELDWRRLKSLWCLHQAISLKKLFMQLSVHTKVSTLFLDG